MKVLLLGLLCGLFAANATADVITDIYCFKSGGDKPIRFELRAYSDSDVKGQVGFIRYANSKTWIPVVLESNQERSISKDRPAQNDSVWDEVINGEVVGTYELEYQGVEVASMTYRGRKKKTSVDFISDVNALLPDGSGCMW
jgi:hypothetical protein